MKGGMKCRRALDLGVQVVLSVFIVQTDAVTSMWEGEGWECTGCG